MTNKFGNAEMQYIPPAEIERDYRCKRGWDCFWLYVQVIAFTLASVGGIYMIFQLSAIIFGQMDSALSI